MIREFVYTRTFFTNWKEAGFEDKDLIVLEEMLLANPKLGAVIPGTGRARKMRFAYEGRGKRGSARVVYVDYEVGEKICFLAAYAKSDKSTLTSEEKRILKLTIDALGKIYDQHAKKEAEE